MEYNVGDVVRDWWWFMMGETPNRVQPGVWIEAVEMLDDLTDKLVAANATRGVPLDQLSFDLARWIARLEGYYWAAAMAPDLSDRYDTLWTVTAPLLLGYYGGPEGTDPLVEGGFAEGFDPAAKHPDGTWVQRPPDIATPYSLANQLGVAATFERERPSVRKEMQGVIIGAGEGLGEAIVNLATGTVGALARGAGAAAKAAVEDVPWWVWAIGVGLGAWWLLKPAAVTQVPTVVAAG